MGDEGGGMPAETEVDLIISRLCEILRSSMQLSVYYDKFIQKLIRVKTPSSVI